MHRIPRDRITTRSDRGTEGSTKRILLGTSFGELYEYCLQSPLSSGKLKSSPLDAKAGEINAVMEDGESDPIDSPVLLHRLNATGILGVGGASRGNIASRSMGGDGSAVCGILFHRVVGGAAASGNDGSGGCVIVLASTGGLHRHTRLHTFRSEPSTLSSLTLRSAFARPASSAAKGGGGSRSFVELPGSVEFAELCSCNDESFALRTETGIYYGTTERSASGIASSLGGTVGKVGAGMLTYDSLGSSSGLRSFSGNSGGMLTTTPASIGLTPHHFITLSSTNNVKFINRVARKVIQEERVDWISLSQTSPAESDLQYRGSVRGASVAAAELITDIRRPDQIWLRKERSLVHISSSCEDRDVWKYHLAQCIETATTPRHNVALSSDGAISSPGALLTSEEKQIESQFEYAKSLCINSVRDFQQSLSMSASWSHSLNSLFA
jgi:hypothetical protein